MLVKVPACENCNAVGDIRPEYSSDVEYSVTKGFWEAGNTSDFYCNSCDSYTDYYFKERNRPVPFAITWHFFTEERSTHHVIAISTENAFNELKRIIQIQYHRSDATEPKEVYIDAIAWLGNGEIHMIEDLPEPLTLYPEPVSETGEATEETE